NMATMFCFVTSDAAVARGALDPILKRAVDRSFNRIVVDGDTSTSDTVAVIANGLAENAPVDHGSRGTREFGAALEALTTRLARMLVEEVEVGIVCGDERQQERLVERGMLREGVLLPRVRAIMGGQAYDITIDLGIGRGEERVWTCDLSEEYVRINAKYTT